MNQFSSATVVWVARFGAARGTKAFMQPTPIADYEWVHWNKRKYETRKILRTWLTNGTITWSE